MSQAEAYARLLAMRQGLYLEGGVMRGPEKLQEEQAGRDDQLPVWVQNLRAGPKVKRLAQQTVVQDGNPSVIMSVEGQPGGDGRPPAPDEEGVKTAVQNFRKILMDIEKQQAMQREQLEKVVQ
jgi:hypothetical protein